MYMSPCLEQTSIKMYATKPGPPETLEFSSSTKVMENHYLHFPSTIQEALDFYIKLKTATNIEMNKVNVS